jgi:hypothetical protein
MRRVLPATQNRRSLERAVRTLVDRRAKSASTSALGQKNGAKKQVGWRTAHQIAVAGILPPLPANHRVTEAVRTGRPLFRGIHTMFLATFLIGVSIGASVGFLACAMCSAVKRAALIEDASDRREANQIGIDRRIKGNAF